MFFLTVNGAVALSYTFRFLPDAQFRAEEPEEADFCEELRLLSQI